MSDGELQGRTALVTGAGSGIGEATARRLAERGARVVCAGRRVERLRAVAAGLDGRGHALALDVTDPTSVDSMLARLPDAWRAIDVLVNGAGHDVGGRRPFDEGSVEDWAAIIDTNVTGLIRVTRTVVEGMLARGRGDVVNVGSVAGLKPYATGGAYVASKHAVHGLSECLRLDFRARGIRVIEVLPGLVRTEFAERRWGDAAKADAFYDEPVDVLVPDDVARAVVYALEQPPHVVVSQLVVLPSSQG